LGGSYKANALLNPPHIPTQWPPPKKPSRKRVRKETESVMVLEKAV